MLINLQLKTVVTKNYGKNGDFTQNAAITLDSVSSQVAVLTT